MEKRRTANWNKLPSRHYTPGTYRDGNNYLVQTLTVEARPEYNGTEIVCVARFDDGSPDEFTSPAFLQGVYCNSFGILDCVHYYTNIILFSISLNTGSELHFIIKPKVSPEQDKYVMGCHWLSRGGGCMSALAITWYDRS